MSENKIEELAKELQDMDATMGDAFDMPMKYWHELSEETRDFWRAKAWQELASKGESAS